MIRRRNLVKGSLAMAAAMTARLSTQAQAVTIKQDAGSGREFYLLRKYTLQQAPTIAAGMNSYLQQAMLPALGRMGIGPAGVFSLTYGPETPTTYLLLPSKDLHALAMLDLHLAQDATFTKDAAAFWGAPATQPPFDRVDSQLSLAFEGYPKLTAPAKEPRIMQLRTYESPTYATHARKVEMFHQGEFRIFEEAGAKGIFYSDNLIGARQPSLTYMLCHKDLAAMDANWKAFFAHPDWVKVSHNPRYASDPTVSRVDNFVLTPAAYSQI